MKIILIIIFFLFYNFANASIKQQIILNFQNTKNLKFKFIQKINNKNETGYCIISYPKKIFCKYNDVYNKILVSNGKSLVINSDRNPQYFRYSLNKTTLNAILDKEFLIEKMINSQEQKEGNLYSFKFNYKNNSVTVFFNKTDLNLTGWKTIDLYQNQVETFISDMEKNFFLDEKVFNIQNYIN